MTAGLQEHSISDDGNDRGQRGCRGKRILRAVKQNAKDQAAFRFGRDCRSTPTAAGFLIIVHGNLSRHVFSPDNLEVRRAVARAS
jgi:hypothetical protein